MPAPIKPNTEAARAASLASRAAKQAAASRDKILSMSPEDRAMMAGLMRQRLANIPGKIAELQREANGIEQWLQEFAPET